MKKDDWLYENLNSRQRLAAVLLGLADFILLLIVPPYVFAQIMGPVNNWATYLLAGAISLWVPGIWFCGRTGVFERLGELNQRSSSDDEE